MKQAFTRFVAFTACSASAAPPHILVITADGVGIGRQSPAGQAFPSREAGMDTLLTDELAGRAPDLGRPAWPVPAQAGRWRALLCLALLVLVAARFSATAAPHTLHVEIQPRFAGAPLLFDALTNVTAAGQILSVTRLDFLLSDIALRQAGGTWFTPSNHVAYLSGRGQRTTFTLSQLPAGDYDRIRFHVGVPERENHLNPGGLAGDHPLNPNVNGLHWSWQGGYVFLALEGDWIRSDGQRSGYSYHLATDPLLMTVELPLELDLATEGELRLALNIDQVFSGPEGFRLTGESTSTHSRAEDTLAAQLRGNIQRAFAVDRFRPSPPRAQAARGTQRIEMATNATPYRLTLSRFFPLPALPRDNPLTEEGVELGRRLFHDPGLFINDRQSCASCHRAESAFTDSRRTSIGAEGQVGTRNAMPLANLAWQTAFSWDGRAGSLREQVLQPIGNPDEMHESLTNVVRKLGRAGYAPAFTAAFGTGEITADRVARALEQFLLTLTSHASKFDRVQQGVATLTADEQRGFELFHTEYDPRRGQFGADCFHCHGGPLFSNFSFHNNGLDADGTARDLGRFLVTTNPADLAKFKTPSLRNVAITAPYMHDGRFATLAAAVAHYATGVRRGATLDPNLAKHPDGGVPLSADDQLCLVAFLGTLTDSDGTVVPAEPTRNDGTPATGSGDL